ncbi:MAG: DEAD/DEAH box helicase [Chloroflexi bacterium]|nr:DEAD/DEAH box helicase [Chloroflexota bacterium]
MISLEDLKPGMRVCGIVGQEVVEIMRVEPLSRVDTVAGIVTLSAKVVYQRGDSYDSTLLYRGDEESLFEAIDEWAYGDDAKIAQLAWSARRIHDLHLFDEYQAIFGSAIRPLPHQIEAVYFKMLGRYPLRYVLADDPGSGKTIMAGLLIREMMARELIKRCLIVVPSGLTQQWHSEMKEKFRLSFTIGDLYREPNCLQRNDLVILRMDQAKLEAYDDLIDATEDWDLVICDEAHKMSASYSGGEISRTQRYNLCARLGKQTRHLLLMTATPQNGKPEDYQLFLNLLDEERFRLPTRGQLESRTETKDNVLRRMKEDLVTLEGTPLFPERRAHTADYGLSPDERELYEAVTHYCREQFNLAEQLARGRKNTVGFAMTSLQRRLASSPEAIYQSLHARRMRLEQDLTEWNEFQFAQVQAEFKYNEIEHEDASAETREYEEERSLLATAAVNREALKVEIAMLQGLEAQADAVRQSGNDSKWDRLREVWLEDLPAISNNGQLRKLIIFTEHVATLEYLSRKLGALLGDNDAIVKIHGSVPQDTRRHIQDKFWNDSRIRVLVATDAAGEGINLHCAHLMVNYDLPWNPNRLEQRFGRIHRIGQTEVCHLWNLVTSETREGAVYERLLQKLDTIGGALQGKVFDVLGELFQEVSLRNLIIEAVRYGDNPNVRRRLYEKVERALDFDTLRERTQGQVLADDVINLDSLRAKLNEDSANRLGNREIRIFLESIFRLLPTGRNSIRELSTNCFNITSVPGVLKEYARRKKIWLEDSYKRACFERGAVPEAEFIGPDHPLLAAAAGWVERHWRRALPQCGDNLPVFLDKSSGHVLPRTLCYVTWSIQNALLENNVIESKAKFVAVDTDGCTTEIAPGAILQFNVAEESDESRCRSLLSREMLTDSSAQRHAEYHVADIQVQSHLAKVQDRETDRLERESQQVEEGLKAEISMCQNIMDWIDETVRDDRDQERVYRLRRTSIEQLKRNLETRLEDRMNLIARQKDIRASGVTVRRVAVIVPASLLHD